MPNGVLRIHDIESSAMLYEQATQSGEHFATLNEIKNGFLNLGISTNKPERVYTFFDLENNIKYSKVFTRNELLEMSKNWTNYVDVFNKYSFKEEKY